MKIIWFLAIITLIYSASAINVSLRTDSWNTTTPINRNWFFSNFSLITNYPICNINSVQYSVISGQPFAATNYSVYDLSLLLMYNFDNQSTLGENNTLVKDASQYGNDGIVINGSYTTPNGKYGKAMQFNGSSGGLQYINTSYAGQDSNPFTISFWFKSIAPDGLTIVLASKFSDYNSWYIDYSTYGGGNRLIEFVTNETQNQGLFTTAPFQDNTWIFVTAVFNGTNKLLYINGFLNSTSIAKPFNSSAANIVIGSIPNVCCSFNGSIDEVRIWNRSLSADEITQAYYSNLNRVNLTNWRYVSNRSGLTAWNYTYSLWANDSTGASNKTTEAYAVFNKDPRYYQCPARGPNNTLNYFVRDTETNASIISNLTIRLTSINKDGTTNVTAFVNVANVSICRIPSWSNGTYAVLATILRATGYSNATFIFTGESVQPAVNYTLPLFSGVTTLVYVLDENKYKLVGAQIEAYKFFPDGSSLLIGSQITDAEGKAVFYLRPYIESYRFKITYGGKINIIGETIVVCTNGVCPPYVVTLNIRTIGTAEYFRLMNQINTTCTVNASSFLVCSVEDKSGLVNRFNLVVEKKGAIIFTELCNQSIVTSSGTLACNLGNTTGFVYRYRVLYYASPEDTSAWALLDYLSSSFNWGTLGFVIALFVILVLFFAGIFNPGVSILSGYFGVVVCWLLGLLPVDLTALIGLGVAVGVIIWRIGV